MRILGVDPGTSGGLAVLDGSTTPPTVLAIEDMPFLQQQRGAKGTTKLVNGAALAAWVRVHRPDSAVIERVGARPKQGATSGFQFGRGLGVVEGVLAALDIGVVTIEPVAWKRQMGLPFGAPKSASRALAVRLYPAVQDKLKRVRDEDRAEALLIATAGLRLW